jgi:predicted DNA-binding helix-hairpin-helix protein
MAKIGSAIVEAKDARKRFRHAPRFAPAGQSTQMIVGADQASDADIVGRSATLYNRFRLRRVYYSAFSPIPDASAVLPLQRPPLMREHRLYQSDWLMRFYGFARTKCSRRPIRAACCRWTSIPSWPGRCAFARPFRWT